MTRPTDQELRAYAEKLPEVYQYVLRTFPALHPDRRIGDGLTEVTLHTAFADLTEYQDEVPDALDQLVARGFLGRSELANRLFYSPTDLGERLIEVVSGRKARVKGAPPLPEPTWG